MHLLDMPVARVAPGKPLPAYSAIRDRPLHVRSPNVLRHAAKQQAALVSASRPTTLLPRPFVPLVVRRSESMEVVLPDVRLNIPRGRR